MKRPNFYYEREFWKKGFRAVVGIDEVGRGAFAGPIVVGAVVFAPTPQIKNEKLKMKNKSSKTSQNPAIAKKCDEILSLGINDSKQLKPRTREKLAKEIKKRALAWDITEVGVGVINKIGIAKATEKAMRKAVGDVVRLLYCYIARLDKKKEKKSKQYSNIAIKQSSNLFVLLDGFHVKYIPGIGLKNQKAIKNGDQKSISIAAASILAKVYRDQIMRRLGKKYPQYGWGRNKQSLFRAKGRDIYGWARNKGYGTKEHQKAILRYGLTRYHRKDFVRTFLERNPLRTY